MQKMTWFKKDKPQTYADMAKKHRAQADAIVLEALKKTEPEGQSEEEEKVNPEKCIFSDEVCRLTGQYTYTTQIPCNGLSDKARCPFWQSDIKRAFKEKK